MPSTDGETPAACARPAATAFALLLFVLATVAPVEARERRWTVTCGLPQQDNRLFALLPTGGYNGPWGGSPHSGHLEVKTLHRLHPESGLSTEMWLLSRGIGWWRLKSIRVHPDDVSKLTLETAKGERTPEVRQIIASPFLSQPAIIRAEDSDGEAVVNGQILSLLPDVSQLRCGSRVDESEAARIAEAQKALVRYADTARIAKAQKALVRHGYDPGPVDGRMGPRTRAALRAFQTEQGFAPDGELDDTIFERLTAP